MKTVNFLFGAKQKLLSLALVLGMFFGLLQPLAAYALETNLSAVLLLKNTQKYYSGAGTVAYPGEMVQIIAYFSNDGANTVSNPVYKLSLADGLSLVGGSLESMYVGNGYAYAADAICGGEANLFNGTGCTQANLAGYDQVGFRFNITVAASGLAANPLQVGLTYTADSETTIVMTRDVRVAPIVTDASPVSVANNNTTAITVSGSGFQNETGVYLISDSTDPQTGIDGATTADSAMFLSAGAFFQSNGVAAGDFLEITTANADQGIYQIIEVSNENTLTLDNNYPGGRIPSLTASNLTYEIHKAYSLGAGSVNAAGTQITNVSVPAGVTAGTYKVIVGVSGGTNLSIYTRPSDAVAITAEPDTAAPVITISSITPSEIETAQTSTITWSANEACTYSVRVGNDGSDITTGTEVTGANANGSFTTGASVATVVNFADLATEGSNTVWIYCTDTSANVGRLSAKIRKDTTAPTTAATPLGGAYSSEVSVSLKAYYDTTKDEEDTGAKIYYTTDGSVPSVTGCPGACAPQGTTALYAASLSINAATSLKFLAVDSLGHVEDYKEEIYSFDLVPPVLVGNAEAISDTQIQLTFNEDILTAGVAGNYTATGILVQDVQVKADDRTKVILTVSPLANTAFTAGDLAYSAGVVCDMAANCMGAGAGIAIDDKQVPSFVKAEFEDAGVLGDATDDLLHITYSESLSAFDLTKISSSVMTTGTGCVDEGIVGNVLTICLTDRTADSASDLSLLAGAVTDANANLSADETGLQIHDTVAPVLTLTKPAADGFSGQQIAVNYNLSEEALAGSVKLTFTRLLGNADVNSPHTVTALLTTTNGQNVLTIDGNDLNADGSATATDTLVNGAIYEICLDAKDLAGNDGTNSTGTQMCRINWSYDVQPTDAPVLAVAFSTPTTINTPTIDWLDVAQDEVLYHFQSSVLPDFAAVFVDNQEIGPDTLAYTYSALSDGVYYARLRTKDAAENYSNWSAVFKFEVDTTVPNKVELTAPLEGAVASGGFTVSGLASDASTAGLNKVEVCILNTTTGQYWDGAAWQAGVDCSAGWLTAIDGTAGGWTSWDYAFAGLINSGENYALQAKATDKAGNSALSTVVNVAGDTTAPTGVLTSHNGGDYLPAGLITLAGTASDNVSVSGVSVRVQRNSDANYYNATSHAWQAGEVWNKASDVSGAGTFANWETDLDTTGVADDVQYVVSVKSIDGALDVPNEGLAADVTLIQDGSEPNSVISAPTATEYTAAEWTGLAGTASDIGSAGLNKVQVRIADSGSNYWDGAAWVSTVTWLDATGTNNWTYAYTPDKDDTFTVSVRAIDNAKRSATVGGNVETTLANVTFVYDTDAPSASDATITAVQEGGNSTLVVTFDEAMTAASVTNTADWSVTDLDSLGGVTDAVMVTNVSYDSVVHSATLTLTGMTWQTGETYRITMTNVTDVAGNAVNPATIDEVQQDYTPPTFVSAKFLNDTTLEVTYNENLNTDLAQSDASRFRSATYFPSGAVSVLSVSGAVISLEIPSLGGDTSITANDLEILAGAVRDASTAVANGNASQEHLTNQAIADGQAPTIISSGASATPNDDTLMIVFSEPVDGSVATNAYSALNLANYAVQSPTASGDETITAASVNGTQVTLTISSALTIGETYTVTVTNVADANDVTNTISSATSTGTVGGGLILSEVVASPIQDWSTNNFDGTIGGGAVDNTDQWVELYVLADGLDLTGIDANTGDFGLRVDSVDETFATVQYFGTGSLNSTKAGDLVVLGNPTNALTTTSQVEVMYQDVTALDELTLATPVATAAYDEAVLRDHLLTDTDNASDFAQGRATLGSIDTVAPTMGTRFPEVNGLIPAQTFTLRGVLTSVGSGVLSASNFTTFQVDGVSELGTLNYDPATQEFTWNASGLALGQHTVRVVVRDNAKNASAAMQWSFWVDKPTVTITNLSALLDPIFPIGDSTDNTEDTLITVTTYGAGLDITAMQDQLLTLGVGPMTIENWGSSVANRGFGWSVTDNTGANYSSVNAFAAPMSTLTVVNEPKVDGNSLGTLQTYTYRVRYTVNPANVNQDGGDYTGNVIFNVGFVY